MQFPRPTHRFRLSFRDVEDLLAERGITVTYETIRHWCRTFGLEYARRRRRRRQGDTWYLDELFVRMQGRTQYLWRAVDEDGDVNRHPRATPTESASCDPILPQALEHTGRHPSLPDHRHAAELSSRLPYPDPVGPARPSPVCEQSRRSVSSTTRHRERQMRGFKSIAHLQRFASVHGVVQNLFRVGRHLLRAAHHRALRTRAFAEWNVVTCAS